MVRYLPDALTTPEAEPEILERLNKLFDLYRHQNEVWDLISGSREFMMGSQYMKNELKRRGTTSADVIFLERLLYATEIATGLMPQGVSVWRFFTTNVLISRGRIHGGFPELLTHSDEHVREIIALVRVLSFQSGRAADASRAHMYTI